jgi:hypothetical protein
MLCFFDTFSSGTRPSRVGLQLLLAREMAIRHHLLLLLLLLLLLILPSK